jgi:hypothetical protein
MKVFLQDAKTGLLFQDPDSWTWDQDDAHQFETLNQALEFARRQHLSGVQVFGVLENAKNGEWVELELQRVPHWAMA